MSAAPEARPVLCVRCLECAGFSVGPTSMQRRCPANFTHKISVREFAGEPDAYDWATGKVPA